MRLTLPLSLVRYCPTSYFFMPVWTSQRGMLCLIAQSPFSTLGRMDRWDSNPHGVDYTDRKSSLLSAIPQFFFLRYPLSDLSVYQFRHYPNGAITTRPNDTSPAFTVLDGLQPPILLWYLPRRPTVRA